jgi:hypothetical protein
VGVNAVGGGFVSVANDIFPALSVVAATSESDLIDACAVGNPCHSTNSNFGVDIAGNIFGRGSLDMDGLITLDGPSGNVNIAGQYQKGGTCVAGCSAATAASPGRVVVSYAPTQSLPSIDDFGEATLQNGSAYVHLDPAFANVIQPGTNYLVFITPEGDSRGLYVTQKSQHGFAVRENMGGHSSLAFSYRIVARPLGSREQRLPMVATPRLRRPMPSRMSQIPR